MMVTEELVDSNNSISSTSPEEDIGMIPGFPSHSSASRASRGETMNQPETTMESQQAAMILLSLIILSRTLPYVIVIILDAISFQSRNVITRRPLK